MYRLCKQLYSVGQLWYLIISLEQCTALHKWNWRMRLGTNIAYEYYWICFHFVMVKNLFPHYFDRSSSGQYYYNCSPSTIQQLRVPNSLHIVEIVNRICCAFFPHFRSLSSSMLLIFFWSWSNPYNKASALPVKHRLQKANFSWDRMTFAIINLLPAVRDICHPLLSSHSNVVCQKKVLGCGIPSIRVGKSEYHSRNKGIIPFGCT